MDQSITNNSSEKNLWQLQLESKMTDCSHDGVPMGGVQMILFWEVLPYPYLLIRGYKGWKSTVHSGHSAYSITVWYNLAPSSRHGTGRGDAVWMGSVTNDSCCILMQWPRCSARGTIIYIAKTGPSNPGNPCNMFLNITWLNVLTMMSLWTLWLVGYVFYFVFDVLSLPSLEDAMK